GSEPQILFYAGRRSASPHLYMYPLTRASEDARTRQEDLIRAVETGAPRFLVQVNVDPSWELEAGSPTRLFEWFGAYVPAHYRVVGVADILPSGTEYRWDRVAAGYQPRGRS